MSARSVTKASVTEASGTTRLFHALWPPLLFGAAFLLAWELVVAAFDIQKFLLPAPSAIASELAESLRDIWDACWVTGANALIGLIAGVVLGVAVSFLVMRFQILNEISTPLAIALNAIPIIVLVPVFNNMFSITSQVPRRLMVTVIVFFIVLVNVSKGLRQVSPTHLELMRSYAASPSTILVKTRIPNAVPFLFTALRIAAPLAVITAFVAEYFGGSQDGLGYAITSNVSASRTDASWAYVMGACALGLAFYLGSISFERVITHQQTGGSTPGGAAT
jgi:NitT/TauT family transport system permease protein